MDVQLSELIEKIKSDGVSTAKEEAQKIIADAEARKADIIREAEKDAESIRGVAKADAERMEASGRAALTQAARDLILQVSRSIQNISETILKAKTADALSGENLTQIILAALEKWDGGEGELSLLLSQKDADSLAKGLASELAARFGEGVEIIPFSGINAGFRVGTKDGVSYFDFTSKEIAQMLSQLVNPQLAALVEEAANNT